jgi:hypothetical protein
MALDGSDPVLRAQLYQELGIEGTYDPHSRVVVVRADLGRPIERAGGPTETLGLPPFSALLTLWRARVGSAGDLQAEDPPPACPLASPPGPYFTPPARWPTPAAAGDRARRPQPERAVGHHSGGLDGPPPPIRRAPRAEYQHE